MSEKIRTDDNKIVPRLKELAHAVTKCDWAEFSMQVPVDLNRDADVVITSAAQRIETLESRVAELEEERKVMYE